MIYEYHCKKCNSTFEKIVKLKDKDEPMPCSACDNEACTKMLSTFGKHLSWSKWRALD